MKSLGQFLLADCSLEAHSRLWQAWTHPCKGLPNTNNARKRVSRWFLVQPMRTRGYLLNCPWFSCFSTHYSAGRQARQIHWFHTLTGATWVLQDASTVKISTNQSLCSTVHS